MAAAAAISSTKKRKRSHFFKTNPSIRKRQQTQLLRKLKANIEEYSQPVGQQAVVLVATLGKATNSLRTFGAKPLEDVMRGLQPVIMTELENALESQATTAVGASGAGPKPARAPASVHRRHPYAGGEDDAGTVQGIHSHDAEVLYGEGQAQAGQGHHKARLVAAGRALDQRQDGC